MLEVTMVGFYLIWLGVVLALIAASIWTTWERTRIQPGGDDGR